MVNFYLLYLSSTNLLDRLFLRSLFDHFENWKKPTILLHDYVDPSIEKTKFIAKRISALLSENLVGNIPISGETKKCLVRIENDILISEPVFETFFQKVPLLILSPIIFNLASCELQLVKAPDILESWRQKNPLLRFFFFSENPLTPLTAHKVFFENPPDLEKYQKLLSIYPEEKTALELSFRLAPSCLASPTNFYK